MPSTTPRRNIILLVNILAPDHDRLTPAAARAESGEDLVLEVVSLDERLDLHALEARDWRRLARRLDELVAEARAVGARAEQAESPVEYVVMGRAPLPVFAYLGQRMRRMNGPIVVINQIQGTDIWDYVGKLPPLMTGIGRPEAFSSTEPSIEGDAPGCFALSVRCSSTHEYDESQLRALVRHGGHRWVGCYQIVSPRPHHNTPLSVEDLPELLRWVDQAQEFISQQRPRCTSLLLAFAGPAWAAFWIGHRLNPQVCGRIDLPNFSPGHGYRPALASPMAGVPLLARDARMSFLAAEPDDQVRFDVGEAFQIVQDRVEDVLGQGMPYRFRANTSTRIDEITRHLRRQQPHVLHLWVHGTEDGTLVFKGTHEESARVTGPEFAALLKRAKARPTLLVVCACYLDAIAPALLEVAECVVAMTAKVASKSALAFCSAFYEMLAEGTPIASAFAEGTFQANAARPVDPGLFQIHYAEGLCDGEVALFGPPEPTR